MPSLLAQVTIPYDSGIPEDITTNTLSFVTSDVNPATLAIVAARIAEFYKLPHAPGTSSIGGLLSNAVAPALTRLKIYDRADLQPRQPIYDAAMPLLGTGAPGLPEEVAVCMSFKAAVQSGQPAARRRGRIYLGPFADTVMTSDAANRRRPSDSLLNAIVGSGLWLMGQSDGTASWVVHSDAAASDATVITVWADDSFDTQRRRGAPPTKRILRNAGDPG